MSKKKASGSSTTMTLKDFHGGSIPSYLPLPSAPGAIVRPSDRAGFDRQSAWGNATGRSDQRLRPGSAGAVRNFDDKSPFLCHSVHIGRNFDEDERKPLDGGSAPRRAVSDESIRAMPVRSELKPDYSSTGRLPDRQVASPVSHLVGSSAASYAGMVAEASYVGVNSQNYSGNSSYSGRFSEAVHAGENFSNSGKNITNVWEMRKEAVNNMEPMPPPWSAPNTASKLAHASALEKVSSGRWQSKQPTHHQTDDKVIRHTEMERCLYSKDDGIHHKKSYLAMDVPSGIKYHDAGLARHAERALSVDDGIRSGVRDLPTQEHARFPKMFPETVETYPSTYDDGFQQSHKAELQPPMHAEQSEWLKMKLLPRSKPLEGLEQPVEHKQVYQQPHDSGHLGPVAESYGNLTKTGSMGSEIGNRALERPKLNLKPRSQLIEQLEGNVERERNSVFGGARPRELVLKDRGMDDITVNNHDLGQHPNRVKQDSPRNEAVYTHLTPSRYNEKAENAPLDNRMKKNNDRQDHKADPERTDMQRRNWRSENCRNGREIEKQQQPQERPPSPETWRKPAEQAKPASAKGAGVHYGKAASAVELAQAFSRPISYSKTTDRFSGQRGAPAQGQIPFSRLTSPSPTPRPQINGY